jgi:heme oxygenase (biliverdin-producing, ferredoxin)
MNTAQSHTGLADRLRRETRAAHAQAERAGIMRNILNGQVALFSYCTLLRNLYEIYAALEPALKRHATHACIAPVYLPALARSGALSADLRALYGARWVEGLEVMPAGHQYRQRVAEIAETRPALLVAHAYTRYLGDLNGGQILRRIVAHTLGLGAGAGTEFYAFPAVENPGATAQGYRDALDRIPVDEALADGIVLEAQHAFALHIRLFEELASAPTPQTLNSPA